MGHDIPMHDRSFPSLASFYLVTGVLALSFCGCGKPAERVPASATGSGVSIVDTALVAALDSCDQKANAPLRWSGNVRLFRQFAMFIPDSVRLSNTEAGASQVDLIWPQCAEQCRFSVAVYSDSGISLEARIARLVAEQRRIDSVNQDSTTAIGEFDELDAPPRPLKTPTASGYVIDHSCGDCAARTLRFGHANLIADVSVSADAFPGAHRRMCEMMVVARSFAWRP